MAREVTGQAVTYTDEIHVNTPERYEIRCITDEVQRIIRESRVTDGLVLVYGVDGRDGPEYRHHRTGEDNGDAHLKRQLLGHQVTMPITDGRLHLGPWEQIHYAEFDGMRRKRILVKIVGVRG